MKIYAVIDTNVIISALLSRHHDSATVRLIDFLYDRVIVPIYNDEILEEYATVLRRPKFNFSEEKIYSILEAIKNIVTIHKLSSSEIEKLPAIVFNATFAIDEFKTSIKVGNITAIVIINRFDSGAQSLVSACAI